MPDRDSELAAWFLRHVPGEPSDAGTPALAPISGLRFPHVVAVARTNREHLGHI